MCEGMFFCANDLSDQYAPIFFMESLSIAIPFCITFKIVGFSSQDMAQAKESKAHNVAV